MRRRLREESGFALLAVMGAVVIITIAALSGFFVSRQALGESVRTSAESRAFQAANTGVDRVLAVPVTDVDVGVKKSGILSNGDSYDAIVARDEMLPDYGYVLRCQGRSGETSETLIVRFISFNLWQMNVGAGDNAGFNHGAGWNGNASIRGPFYIRGDMDWTEGDSTFEGGPLLIRDGALLLSGSATVGLERPIYLFATNGMQGKLQNVYLVNNPPGTSVPDLQLSWIDDEYFQEKIVSSKTESFDNLMGTVGSARIPDQGSNNEAVTPGQPSYPDAGLLPYAGATYYKYLVPSGGAMTGSHDFVVGDRSFGRWPGAGYPAGSAQFDDFAYDANSDRLYVNGVVVVDGDLTIENVQEYVGNGTLVVNGDVHIATDLQPPGNQMSALNCLGIATDSSVWLDNSEMTGAVFCNGVFQMTGTKAGFWGSVLAGKIDSALPSNYLHTNPALKDAVPADMPDADGWWQLTGTTSRM